MAVSEMRSQRFGRADLSERGSSATDGRFTIAHVPRLAEPTIVERRISPGHWIHNTQQDCIQCIDSELLHRGCVLRAFVDLFGECGCIPCLTLVPRSVLVVEVA